MPSVDQITSPPLVGARPDGQRDSPMIERDRGLRVAILDGQQVTASPHLMALPLDESLWSLAGLSLQLCLLFTNPAELGDGIGARDLQPRGGGSNEYHPAFRRINGEVYIFDVLARDLYREVAELEHLAHQQ